MWLGEVDEVVGVMANPYKPMEGESLAHAILRYHYNEKLNQFLLIGNVDLSLESTLHLKL